MMLSAFFTAAKRCSLLATIVALAAISQFSLAVPASAQTAPAGAATQTASPAKPAPAKSASGAALLDINSASADKLKSLPGITDASAQKIIAGRPYRSKAQLVSKGIVTKDVYSKISGMIIAKQSTTASKATSAAAPSK